MAARRKKTNWEIIHGDCREVLRTFKPNTFDSVCTDPPYGIGFMLRGWDHEVPDVRYWKELVRVAKPGAYGAIFGGTRTWHRLACAVEDAGWQLRDTIMWVYSVGFPHNASAAVAFDKANGKLKNRGKRIRAVGNEGVAPIRHGFNMYEPISDEAKQWNGYGTSLKPCWEPILLVQKPFKGNIVTNIRKWGTGVLNIDASRVATDWSHRSASWKKSGHTKQPGADKIASPDGHGIALHPGGLWPPNIVATHAPDCEDDRCVVYCPVARLIAEAQFRFFYEAKASRKEREAGLDHLPSKRVSDGRKKANDTAYQRGKTDRRNIHPTVKPESLIRFLTHLVTPAQGHVIDPFVGSGTAGVASVPYGFEFTGIELKKDHCKIARARIVEAMARAGKAQASDLAHAPGRKRVQLGIDF